MLEGGSKLSFENASFTKREFQFEMVHPDTQNYCPKIGTTSWVRAKGHLKEEAKSSAKKTCRRCKADYVFKQS